MLKVTVRKQLGLFTLDASFTSEAGVTALFGPSGSGKTTLVNAIAGLIRPQRGVIELNGETVFDDARGIDVPVSRRRIGYVFQEGRLFPHMTVRANLRYGRDLARRQDRYVEFDHVVELLGLAHLLARWPANLSGGEKQRVAIGRALLASPRVLLMDEPLAALDHLRRHEILRYIELLRDDLGIPIVYVSHAVDEVVRLADTVVMLAGGAVVTSGSVSEVMGHSELRSRAGVFEGGTVIEATVSSCDLEYEITTLSFAGGELRVVGGEALVGEAVRVRIRARDVTLALERPADVSALNVLEGRVRDVVVTREPAAEVRIEVGATLLRARVTRFSVDQLRLAPGVKVFALIKAVLLDQRD
jgi:molybdate transport system ATP-binding protein